MDIKEHTTPNKLEQYAFQWSLLRLVIGAVSLFFGAMPVAYKVFGSSGWSLLQIAWIISGIASLYLLYMWHKGGMKVFGKSDTQTKVLFLILVISGLNLGWTGLVSNNVGMGLVYSFGFAGIIYKLTALLYLYVAYTLWNGWKANGESLFAGVGAETPTPETAAAVSSTTDTKVDSAPESAPETQAETPEAKPEDKTGE